MNVFFFNDTATTEIYTLSLHDALPISDIQRAINDLGGVHALQYARLWNAKRCLLVEGKDMRVLKPVHDLLFPRRSEEHTSELQSRQYLVCRLLLEKKNQDDFTKLIGLY